MYWAPAKTYSCTFFHHEFNLPSKNCLATSSIINAQRDRWRSLDSSPALVTSTQLSKSLKEHWLCTLLPGGLERQWKVTSLFLVFCFRPLPLWELLTLKQRHKMANPEFNAKHLQRVLRYSCKHQCSGIFMRLHRKRVPLLCCKKQRTHIGIETAFVVRVCFQEAQRCGLALWTNHCENTPRQLQALWYLPRVATTLIVVPCDLQN